MDSRASRVKRREKPILQRRTDMSTKFLTSDSRSAVRVRGIAPMQPFSLAPGKLRGTRDRIQGVNRRSIGTAHSGGGDAWLRRTDDAMFANYFDPSM